MLSIGKLGEGQEAYYLDKVAEGAEEYYSGAGEVEGYWTGTGAEGLGLAGKVTPEGLTAMLTGDHPGTGDPLGLRHGGTVPGFDLTFSVPKSVSLTWALGGEGAGAEVLAAHRASVAAALAYMERETCWTRRGHGGHRFVHGDGFIGAAYLHRSSRNGDPQIHTHVLVANATLGPDGRWTRLYHPAIYHHARTAGHIFGANLRHELTLRLGVDWGEVKNGSADIEGFDPRHLKVFSTRSEEIEQEAGPEASARARQVANLVTRKAKDREISEESLRERWRRQAEEIGLDRESIRRTFGRITEIQRFPVHAEDIEDALTARASHFDRRDAIMAVASEARLGAPAAEIEATADAFLARDAIVHLGNTPRGPRYTTRRVWETEQKALATAAAMAESGGHGVVDETVVTRTLDRRSTTKSDQRAMVIRLTRGGEGLVVVVGEAGTGKTFATVAAAEAWSSSGIPLRVAAPTWRAANVLRSEGLDATSVARLLAGFDRAEAEGHDQLRPGSVLLVDEAGMVDSATLARLIDHAVRAEAKLVLVGDPAQLGEIEAGGLFASIVSRTDPVLLDQVIRHEHELDREGARRIREGHGAEAIEVYRSEGRVVVSEDPVARREEMVRDWWRSFGEGEDALMIAKRNAEVARLNALAREVMREEGRLGDEAIEVGGRDFAVGDQVITRVNDHRAQIYNRERWRVETLDAEAREVGLVGIDTARRVGFDAGYLARENPNDGSPALQHAYAATTYQSQGSTVDRAYVMADPSMDRQELYVAASRSREETWLYATPDIDLERAEYAPGSAGREGIAHIAAAAERDGAQVSAHDQALRSRLERLSSPELVRLRQEIASEAGSEARVDEERARSKAQITDSKEALARIAAERDELPGRPSWGAEAKRRHDQVVRDLGHREQYERWLVESHRTALEERPSPTHEARAETAAIDAILDRRRDLALAAARVQAPDHIVAELGERPEEGRERVVWDRAVRDIEGYRQTHGLLDRDTAIGPEPEGWPATHEHREARRAIDRAQDELGIERERVAELERTIGRERSRSFGIEL